jgi:hypothetical protein
MNKAEEKAVENALRITFSMFHRCALSKNDAKAMNMKPGTLCDDCEAYIKAHLADIKDAGKNGL